MRFERRRAGLFARIRVTHEVATVLELFDQCRACGEFDSESVLRKRLDTHGSNLGGHIGTRETPSKQGFDLPLAHPSDRREELRVVLVRQVMAKQRQRRDVHGLLRHAPVRVHESARRRGYKAYATTTLGDRRKTAVNSGIYEQTVQVKDRYLKYYATDEVLGA